jgi:L-fuconolactonase
VRTSDWTRRAFLRAGATTLGGLAAGCATPGGPAHGGGIDAHAHVWSGPDARYPFVPDVAAKPMNPAAFPPEILLAHGSQNGLRRAVLVQPACYGFDCRFIADSIERFPGRLAGVGLVDWRHEPREGLDRMAALGLRGVRIKALRAGHQRWPEDERMYALWRRAADLGVAVCILPEPSAFDAISKLCTRHPQTIVVVDHIGWLGAHERPRDSQVDGFLRLAEHRNLYVKISRLHHFDMAKPPYLEAVPLVRRVVGAFGPERVMWGSDAPGQVRNGHSMAASLDVIRRHASFRPEEQDWLLGRTAERLFFSA